MDVKKLKRDLSELSPKILTALTEIIENSEAPVTPRLKAIEMVLDRIGLPALRATISQTLTGQRLELPDLIETRKRLLTAQHETEKEIQEVKAQLSAPSGKGNGGDSAKAESHNCLYVEGV